MFSGGILIKIFDSSTSNRGFWYPGECLWSTIISPDQYTRRLYTSGQTGWSDPQSVTWMENTHNEIYQYCVTNIPNPFTQQAGQLYWLMLTMDIDGGLGWGWNTAEGLFGDTAVYWGSDNLWYQLSEITEFPDPQPSHKLSFVLVPEPATLLLLSIGGLLLRKR